MMGTLKRVGIQFFCMFKDFCKFCLGLGLIIIEKLKHVGIRLFYWFMGCCKVCFGLVPIIVKKLKYVGIRLFYWFMSCCKVCFGFGRIVIEKTKRAGKRIYNNRKRFYNYFKRHVYQIFHFIMLGALWTYIVLNWDKCISMQFFSRFDGNNILFIVGILLMILHFYEIEGGGIKIRKTGEKELERELNQVESEYRKIQIQNIIVTQSQGAQRQTEVTENE